MPILLLPKSIATAELIAYTIIAKYCDHLPLYRQEGIWQRLEIDLPRSSLCGWILKTAETCAPLIKLLRNEIINHDYVQADETTVQVLEEVGRSNTTKSYMCIWSPPFCQKVFRVRQNKNKLLSYMRHLSKQLQVTCALMQLRSPVPHRRYGLIQRPPHISGSTGKGLTYFVITKNFLSQTYLKNDIY